VAFVGPRRLFVDQEVQPWQSFVSGWQCNWLFFTRIYFELLSELGREVRQFPPGRTGRRGILFRILSGRVYAHAGPDLRALQLLGSGLLGNSAQQVTDRADQAKADQRGQESC
jgi:hypothetical protein